MLHFTPPTPSSNVASADTTRRRAARPAPVVAIATTLAVLLLALGASSSPEPLRAQGGPFDHWERKPLADWLTIGAVTPTEALIKLHVKGDAREVRIAASRHADLRDPVLSEPTISDDELNDGLSFVNLRGLEPDTRYHLAVLADGKIDTARRASFRTFPDGPGSFRVVSSGDISPTGKESAVYGAITTLDPLLFLTVGDIIDRTLSNGSIDEAREHWRIFRATQSLTPLMSNVPWAHMLDDHDYGKNNGDRTFLHRWAARQSYQETVPHYPLALREHSSHVALGQAFSIGRVRFILTDLRSEREPRTYDDTPTKSMIGHKQKVWFVDELHKAKREHALIIWVSTVPWIADTLEHADHWGGYAVERREIAAHIKDAAIPVVVLSGDAHTVAIDDGSHGDYAPDGGAPLPAIQTGALAAVGKAKAGLGPFSHGRQPNRNDAHGYSVGDGQFVTLDVTDFGGSRLCLQVQGWRHEGPTQRLVKMRRFGAGDQGPLLRWGRCWDARPVNGVNEHRLALPYGLGG